MNLQIELKICRACLTSDTSKLTEADAEALKNFHFILNTELSSPTSALLPKTFCDKCLSKLKLATAFKRQSVSSEDYLKNFVQKINQEFAKSLSNFSEGRQNINENAVNEDDQEIELLLQEEVANKVEVAKEDENEKNKKNPPSLIRIEKVTDQIPTTTAITTTLNLNTELYSNEDEEQHLEEEDEAIFGDKEIYDIMEIDNNYVDEAGNTILTRDVDDDEEDDDEAQFILLNYKSGDEFSGVKEERYIVEEIENDEKDDDKPTRKKNMKRMPKELIEKYAQSTDNNQHMCKKCVKVFSTRTNLIRHIQSHDGNKPYVCNICNKGFTQSGSLKQHVYIHSGERPYKCKYCDRAFTQQKTLKFHLRRHLDEKPFLCQECNATFRQRDGLKRHLKARHNIELKYDRTNQMDEKIISFVNIDESDEKSKRSESDKNEEIMEIIEEEQK
ncbi:hypothetical protein PVAND_015449 [Polypedilum vanderplanki]|uniref:Zinc finger protein n=1 Tax=Polypedilum vanderplanki TaxID=319348 RepID=A0A9J6BCM1_POLVA|nr:hypothetical protein PVAND_015449 [Polypedilum vanderplanki]